jgi:ring-1,2-phenylacetyl-CoA epoxidase subunit PaaC
VTEAADRNAMTAASISLTTDPGLRPRVDYLLRLGDTCLIHGQRLAEWCGHAPVLEEDIAMSNIALDLIGQARAVLTRAAEIDGHGHDEDRLAFLREERDFRNLTLVELPNADVSPGSKGRDFAVAVVRNTMMAVYLDLWWQQLLQSGDTELAGIAGKASKEARYHHEHAGDWFVRLGDGTAESNQRMQKALNHLWPYVAELFDADSVDAAAEAAGLGPSTATLAEPWHAAMDGLLAAATLARPKPPAFRSHGKRGQHSEHMGFILAEMQYLQRAYPGGVW